MGRKNKSKVENKFFLADSQGFIICVEKTDLIVADVATVKVTDNVKFKYGAEILNGVITFMSGNYV